MSYLEIEKVVKKVGNRFDLVLIASYLARQIQLYNKKFIKKKKDKPTILALKKIEKQNCSKKLIFKFINKI